MTMAPLTGARSASSAFRTSSLYHAEKSSPWGVTPRPFLSSATPIRVVSATAATGGEIGSMMVGPVTEENEMVDQRHADQAADAGKTAGIFAGMLGGARLGQTAIPIPFLGIFIGGVVGGVVGSELGQRLGRAVVNGGFTFVETLAKPAD